MENINEIFVDINEGAGDALYFMQSHRKNFPFTQFYLPVYQSHYLRLFNLKGIFTAKNKRYPILILGKEYNLTSLVYSKNIYQFINGNLIRRTYWNCITEKVVKLAALLVSLFWTPIHAVCLLNSYKN